MNGFISRCKYINFIDSASNNHLFVAESGVLDIDSASNMVAAFSFGEVGKSFPLRLRSRAATFRNRCLFHCAFLSFF
jgi:hypothetical protein